MDRQDIDALLVGALYGELTPAEEAQLAAHLESHPADRGALDDLKSARQAVLDSRIFAVQLEPPQAVSALLLQEAHRRAPKRAASAADEAKESWFYRLARAFLAHPAMAAAAMLVIVLGGAGIVYMKKGDLSAGKEASEPLAEQAPVPELTPAAATGYAGSAAYEADLYDGTADSLEAAAGPEQTQANDSKRDEPARERRASKSADSGAIVVGTQKGEVKELDRVKKKAPAAKPKVQQPAKAATVGRAADDIDGDVSGAASHAAPAEREYAQPPPASAGAPATGAGAPPAPPAARTVAESSAAPARDDSALVAWARGQHERAVTLAQNGNCTEAAKVALGVSNRASSYYAQNMATDRALKQCASYINAERDRAAERSRKTRVQKNRTTVSE